MWSWLQQCATAQCGGVRGHTDARGPESMLGASPMLRCFGRAPSVPAAASASAPTEAGAMSARLRPATNPSRVRRRGGAPPLRSEAFWYSGSSPCAHTVHEVR